MDFILLEEKIKIITKTNSFNFQIPEIRKKIEDLPITLRHNFINKISYHVLTITTMLNYDIPPGQIVDLKTGSPEWLCGYAKDLYDALIECDFEVDLAWKIKGLGSLHSKFGMIIIF